MKKHNIVLVGFMGTGKTTTGKILSQKLGYDFVDTDVEIEKRCGRSVEQIFDLMGEEYFRDIESKIIFELSECNGIVIACGGGVVKREENINNLKKNGLIVLLKAHVDAIYDRIACDDKRPLVRGKSKDEVYNLILEREQMYNVFDVSIDTTDKSPLNVARTIADICMKSL